MVAVVPAVVVVMVGGYSCSSSNDRGSRSSRSSSSSNECSESKGWPIPNNVYRMLQRLGNRKKAKFYAEMDLTSGYYQAPLSKSSQAATATFITDIGTFEWL